MLVDVGREVLEEGEDGGAAAAAEGHGRHDEQPRQEGVRALHELELGVVDREVARRLVRPLLHRDGVLERASEGISSVSILLWDEVNSEMKTLTANASDTIHTFSSYNSEFFLSRYCI